MLPWVCEVAGFHHERCWFLVIFHFALLPIRDQTGMATT